MGLSVSTQRTKYSIGTNNGLPIVSSSVDAAGGASATMSFNNNTFTPTKRAGIQHGNFTFGASFGPSVFAVDGQVQINGFGSYQDIIEEDKDKWVPAFGYENTEKGEEKNGVLDFNREKDRTFNKHTTVVPVTNYTHDVYAIQGQGVNGMFRPYRSQVSYLSDHRVIDQGTGVNLGVKIGVGWNFYVGGRLEASPTFVESGKWVKNNTALNKFIETENDKNPLDYEPSYFKMVGEQRVDNEEDLFENKLAGVAPMKLKISDGEFDHKTLPTYQIKNTLENGTISYTDRDITEPNFKRTKRDLRNQSIIKITQEEAAKDPLVIERNNAIKHHTAGIKILKPDGSTYVYGETAYNNKKVEATFDVSGRSDVNCIDGTVGFSRIPNPDGNPLINEFSPNSSGFSDQYLNRITTPAYAHTYLLKSVLSSDYEDVSGDGPSPDDLGAYTLFTYDVADTDYKWRIPYDYNKVSYNEGLKSNENDQKGNYIYGEKELKYISKIETKTHVAIFHLSNREDARGARGEVTNDESSPGYMKKIDKISLYSKPEYDALGDSASPIKEAHFEYNYELCKGVPNNLNGNGKLTLDKIYFTYRDSHMGRYTPYTFNYDGFNPDYNLKSYDIWGNYKPVTRDMISYDAQGNAEFVQNEAGITVPKLNENYNPTGNYCSVSSPLVAPEFPFVQQEDKKLQDAFASAWTMTSIDLPSVGKLEMEYESDDYQYVQNRKAMQMFMVTGASNAPDIRQVDRPYLYDPTDTKDHAEYIYVKLSDQVLNIDGTEFEKTYLGDQINEPIQFRFLLNMVAGKSHQYDYVSGYFEIDRNLTTQILSDEGKGTYAAIPVKKLNRDDGNKKVNPIAKAGWYFGRNYLNKQVYSIGGNGTTTNFKEILEDLVGSLGELVSVFTGPNAKLQGKRCAMEFEPEKSWVRLMHPDQHKLGGGIRVKEIRMQDRWDVMTQNNDARYAQFYGQQYTYNAADGSSYGVATFEPNGNKENPFVEPFYNEKANSELLGKDQLAAPQESNYAEKPFGESFFPSSTVTYSKVETKNLPRTRTENGKTYVVKKSATGKVVNEMFTTKDFPTIVDFTELTKPYDQTPPLLNALSLGVVVIDKSHLTLSQGFTVVTNDMNGRVKKQQVYAEGQEVPISEVEYKYSVDDNGELNNKLPVIDADGKIHTDKSIAMHYDVVNEFRENDSDLKVVGVNANLTGFLVAIWPSLIPVPLPAYAEHEQILRTATTTKVIHKSGVLVEKIARDLGSDVSTKNLAWDAVTGDVLLTQTINEYGNHYYNFKYPSHWYYDGMGQASSNVGISGALKATEDVPQFTLEENIGGKSLKTYFRNGDELMTSEADGTQEKLWVIHVADDYLTLMNSEGFIINQECSTHKKTDLTFKIVRSGYRNQQMASMASVTSMINPIDINNDGVLNDFSTANFGYGPGATTDPRIVNASAVAYSDYWKPQKELNLPGFPTALSSLYDQIHNEVTDTEGNELTDESYITTHKYGFNPYLYNVRGDWRAIKSYAYLGGRKSNVEDDNNFTTESEGYLTSFNSFYDNAGDNWNKDKDNWTFASQVTTYSPYGAELENKDALDRYSAAQYGYDYTLPVAVGSNAQYREMGYDGFEDYKDSDRISASPGGNLVTIRNNHFDFKSVLGGKIFSTERTDAEAHTGKYSIAVPGGVGEVMQNVLLNECPVTVANITCGGDSGGIEIVDNEPGCQPSGITSLSITFNDETITEVDYRVSFSYDNTCNMSSGKTFINGVNKSNVGTISIGQVPYTISMAFTSGDGVAGVAGYSPVVGNLILGERSYNFEICSDGGCNNQGDPVGGNGF